MVTNLMGDHSPYEVNCDENIVTSCLYRYVPRRSDIGIRAMIGRISDVTNILADIQEFGWIVSSLSQAIHLGIDAVCTRDIGCVLRCNCCQEIFNCNSSLQYSFAPISCCRVT